MIPTRLYRKAVRFAGRQLDKGAEPIVAERRTARYILPRIHFRPRVEHAGDVALQAIFDAAGLRGRLSEIEG